MEIGFRNDTKQKLSSNSEVPNQRKASCLGAGKECDIDLTTVIGFAVTCVLSILYCFIALILDLIIRFIFETKVYPSICYFRSYESISKSPKSKGATSFFAVLKPQGKNSKIM